MKFPTQKLYIYGEYVDASSTETFQTVNPATAEIICNVAVANQKDVDLAVESSQKGFNVWSALTGAQRGRILLKAVALLRKRNKELAELEVLDTGKPLSEAESVDIASGADCLEYYAGLAASLHGHHYDLGSSFAYTRREPLGVCVGIGAWNYPIQIACWKSAPALACGNAMIFKPAEQTPLTALKLAEIYSEAGVPPGVFNVVQGDAATGRALVQHPGVAKVSLTGEMLTGKIVMSDAAKTLKKVTMELGGKSPLIIFEDADLNNAISAALLANFYTQGEICSNGTRVFIEKSRHDEFVKRLVERVNKLTIGDPMDLKTHVGALISEEHRKKVLSYIKKGEDEGAKRLCGGVDFPEHLMGTPFEKGNFVSPTIFDQCTDSMTIVKEEIFGPVMSILTFDSEEEVIERANNTDSGLAAGVFTKDIQRAHRVISQLQAGTCWINNYNLAPIEVPFGGYKQSGVGRENGLITLEHYTQLKSVYVEMGNVEDPYL